jgi:hypothetical protein
MPGIRQMAMLIEEVTQLEKDLVSAPVAGLAS